MSLIHASAVIEDGAVNKEVIEIIYINSSDYPTVDGKSPKLRLRLIISTPTDPYIGTLTFALYPVSIGSTTASETFIYDMGATYETGSELTPVTNPAIESIIVETGSDFALPDDGSYVIGVVSSAVIPGTMRIHLTAVLQFRND